MKKPKARRGEHVPNRSRIHMLRVLAMRLADTRAPENMVAVLRKASEELEAREADGRTGSAEEQRRIEQQRTLFNMLPSCGATDRLCEAMMQRAYDLMWNGDGLATDAILEFLPSAAADEVLNAWESDVVDDDKSKSRFH